MSVKNHFCATCADRDGHVQWLTENEAEIHRGLHLDHNVRHVGESV